MAREKYVREDVLWALEALCAVYRQPFDAQLLLRQFPPPYDDSTLIRAARALGFKAKVKTIPLRDLARLPLPVLVEVRPADADGPIQASLGLVIAVADEQVVWLGACAAEA